MKKQIIALIIPDVLDV